jgi:hypothetical protein
VIDLAPAVVETRLQVPALTAATQFAVPSLTVTFPVSATPRLPGAFTVTLQFTAYDSPTTVGVVFNDAAFEIVVVVAALLTTTEFDEVLLPSLLSTITLFGSTADVPPPPRGFA